MKQIVSVNVNQLLAVNAKDKELNLVARAEIIIIHTDGMDYKDMKDGIKQTPKYSEQRLIVSVSSLDEMIAKLQIVQKNLKGLEGNAALLNEIVKSIAADENKEPK